MPKSKTRKNHKEKLAKRNTRIATDKYVKHKRIQEYIKQIMAQEEQKKNESVDDAVVVTDDTVVDAIAIDDEPTSEV